MKKWIMGYGVQVGPCFSETMEHEIEISEKEYKLILKSYKNDEDFEEVPGIAAIVEREYPNIKSIVLEDYEGMTEEELDGLNIWANILAPDEFEEHDIEEYIENYDEYMEECGEF